MSGYIRIKSPWSQLGLFFGLIGACYLAGGLVSLLIYQTYGFSLSGVANLNWNEPRVISMMKLLQALSSILFFLLPAFLFALFTFPGRYGYYLGLKPAEKPNMYVLAMLCLLLSLPFVFWLGNLNQQIPLPTSLTNMEKEASKQMEGFLKVRQPSDVWLNVFIIAFLPAVCEELCFRAVLQRILINITRNPWAGIIVTAILFSALHMQFQGFLPRMFLGIVLGALYWYSGSLWTSMLAHFVYNGLQVLAVSYSPKLANENPGIPLLLSLASGVAVWAILWFYRRQSSVTYSKVYNPDSIGPFNNFMQ